MIGRAWLRAATSLGGIPALLLALAACGGAPPVSPDLQPENAWTAPVPASATIVTSAEFSRLLRSGEIELRSTKDVAAQAAALRARLDSEVLTLQGLESVPPDIADLLAGASPGTAPVGAAPSVLPDGTAVLLNGTATRLHDAVMAEELANDVQNALTTYTVSYDLLPDGLKEQAPSPDSLSGATLAEVMAALAQLDDLLAGDSSLHAARLEVTHAAPGRTELAAARDATDQAQLAPGQGTDEDTGCSAPTGLAALFWFPLKSFLSPVKSQGNRGSCWAFAALGAVESQQLVQNDRQFNLSEQFLVNQVKRDWAPSDYSEGFWGPEALNLAIDRGQSLVEEFSWTYNQAPNRPSLPDGDAAAFENTCDPYGLGTNGGSCSESAHESPVYCTDHDGDTYCAYALVVAQGGAVPPVHAYQVWHNSGVFDFNLNLYRQLLASGHVLIASFPVYKGFMDDAVGGYVDNFATTHLDADGKEVPGAYGGHEALIVGFISNEELAAAHHPSDVPGGGYFVLKNSWGCGAGDGGYYYVPARYVNSFFDSLYALDFGPERSAAWTHEQQYPGSTEAPRIQTLESVLVDLRVEQDLGAFFDVTHPVAKTVHLKVSSDRDGLIYEGGWITDPFAFGSTLPYTFQTTGARRLELTASYGGRSSQASFDVSVMNWSPDVDIETSGVAHRGEPYPVTAVIHDVNEPNPSELCQYLVWSVEAPDQVTSASGCQAQITFGAQGERTVRAAVHDQDGAEGEDSVTLEVAQPPENPYPRIITAGVYSRQFHGTPPVEIYRCGDVSVVAGAVIDFEALGCTPYVDPDAPRPPKFSAAITVENPDAEFLTYDWRVYVSIGGSEQVLEERMGSASTTFVPYSPGNSVPVTYDCRVWVRVNATDEARSKSQTVWQGRCSYLSTHIG